MARISDMRYDLVISGARVVDPETGLDAVRNVGIVGNEIAAVTVEKLGGGDTIDASGMVVCPGFIDMHSHGQDEENYAIQVKDGVTTALELEVGTADVNAWYAEREGTTAVNYGATVGHIPVRADVMNDAGGWLPEGDGAHREATDVEIGEMAAAVRDGLEQGALGVGFGVMYTPAASRWEVLEMFRVAARYGASCHIHMRGHGHRDGGGGVDALEEALAAAVITGAPLHVVHIASTALGSLWRLLQMIGEARDRGIDVTTECYPYAAGMTRMEAATFDGDWRGSIGIDYGDLEYAETGERLTAESFARYRKTGGWVILHMIPDDVVDAAVTSPLTAIASDGIINNGKGHPRTAGTYSRILGQYVRDRGLLSMEDAVRKMALMPAQRLEARAPMMKRKGRVQVGCDADLVVFQPEAVLDQATYQKPTTPPVGIDHVLVNGTAVVSNGVFQGGVRPGLPVRAPIR